MEIKDKISMNFTDKKFFSEKALEALNGFYVYALMDPRDEKIFYIGKGIGNRVFSHEIESEKRFKAEKQKLKKYAILKEMVFL